MNPIAYLILFFLLMDWMLNAVADGLNLNAAADNIPEPFKDLYDKETYEQSRQYLKANTLFGQVTGVFDLAVILIFWFSKGFLVLDQWVRAFSLGPVASGMIYIGILILLKTVLSLPFDIYGTFVIEERFGFNKTTWKTWMMDRIKGLALLLLLGGPLLAGILAFFQYAGGGAWIWCWLAVTIFMLFVQFVAPTWIMPLFNKFSPLKDGELKTAIVDYARSIEFSLDNIFVMDGSKRSSKSNAFFTGFGKNKRIVLFDTLIEKHTTRELVSVLAHEMGHYRKKHILKMLLIGILQTGAMFFLMSLFLSYQGLFDAFFVENKSVYAGLIFFGMLYSPIDLVLGIFVQRMSRKHEYEADRFAVETSGYTDDFMDALKKLSVHNLSNLLPHAFYVFLNYSHPPVIKRVEAIRSASGGI